MVLSRSAIKGDEDVESVPQVRPDDFAQVLPGFVWVKIQWSEPFVFKAWGNATAFSVSEALGGRDQQDPQVPPPTPPTPFPSEMWQVRDFLS